MAKSAEAFRSIGEVAKLIGVAPHVLRYWETQFSLLKPMKRADGRRYYRPDDVRLVAGLCEILREEGLTIRGAKKMLAKDRGESVRARGAVRLGEALEPQDSAPIPEVADPMPLPQAAGHIEDDAAPERSPKSRSRKRPAPRGQDTLPLFPELPDEKVAALAEVPIDPDEDTLTTELTQMVALDLPQMDSTQVEWLRRLTRTAATLRATDRLTPPADQQAQALHDLIADMF